LFLGIDSVKANIGVFTHYMEEAYLNQIMIDIADEVILVADSTKFNRSGLAFICGFDKINTLITDSKILAEDKEMLEKNNIEIILV
jgi:DeoR family transcriptional regulator of aga operon